MSDGISETERRIQRLETALTEQVAQRDWLLSVNWSDDGGTAEQAVANLERSIATYQFLLARLKARL